MPLEIRELVVQVNVGSNPEVAPRAWNEAELAALKRELIEACLAELRQSIAARDER